MDIVKVNLENEMDLMLAYKRSMKLAELCGLTVLLQTSFATAVSEIARCVIRDKKDKPVLNLSIDILRNNKKDLVASIFSKVDFEKDFPDALKYAKRLSDNVSITKQGGMVEIRFVQNIGLSGLINEARLEGFVKYFKSEIPLSPYDEIRRKNIMLLEVSDKLRNSENRYKNLTKTLPLMVFTTNAVGNLNYANKWMMDFFKLAEMTPDKINWMSFMHTSEVNRIRKEWESALTNHAAVNMQAKIKDKEGFVWHIISLSPVREEGQLTGWAGFFVDIHSQKLIEETLKDNKQLKETQKELINSQATLKEKIFELKKSNHDLEQFAYIASHDLQEPLRKIMTFSELVKKNIGNPEMVNTFLDKIETSSARMTALVKDVLNYSRLIKSDNSFVDTDIEQILKNILIDMELVIGEKKAVIMIGSLPHLNVVPRQLYQLFYNLLSNSLKFNNGIPEINISAKVLSDIEVRQIPALLKKLKYTLITFRDNGIGFDEKHSSQIFTIFKRLHNAGVYEGTGIGLALCKKIVENHHGVITAQSEPGKGSEFRIILPLD